MKGDGVDVFASVVARPDPESTVTAAEAFECYRAWVLAQEVRPGLFVGTPRALGMALRARGFVATTVGGRVRYRGLALAGDVPGRQRVVQS